MDPETDADRKHFYSSACTNCTCFNSHQISARGGSWSEHVWTGLQRWPRDVTSRGKCPCTVRSHVWRGPGSGVPIQKGPVSGGGAGVWGGSSYSEVPCPVGGWEGGLYSASWVMVTCDRSPVNRQTVMTENNAFPQLRWGGNECDE